MSRLILNITCARCGYAFATASHKYYKEPEGHRFTSDIMCAADSCTYLIESTSYKGPDDVMRKAIKSYLKENTDAIPEAASTGLGKEE